MYVAAESISDEKKRLAEAGYGLTVGMATGAGAINIESAEALVCTTPGEGGGGGGGGTSLEFREDREIF